MNTFPKRKCPCVVRQQNERKQEKHNQQQQQRPMMHRTVGLFLWMVFITIITFFCFAVLPQQQVIMVTAHATTTATTTTTTRRTTRTITTTLNSSSSSSSSSTTKGQQERRNAVLSERDALRILYTATLGSQWRNQSHWMGIDDDNHNDDDTNDETGVPICAWYGVTCRNVETGLITTTANSGVTALDLSNNNLAGIELPHILWNGIALPQLRFLDFSHNSIRQANFDFPSQSQQLSQQSSSSVLEVLDLSYNFLTNVNGLEHIASSLKELQLSANQLYPYFPTQIHALTQLERLYFNNQQQQSQQQDPTLSSNHDHHSTMYYDDAAATTTTTTTATTTTTPMIHSLSGGGSGSSSNSIGQLSNLVEFYGSGNQWMGTIPTELGLWNKLQILSLSDNQFIGTIPTEFNQLINLQILSLHSTRTMDDTTNDIMDGNGSDGSDGGNDNDDNNNKKKNTPGMSLTGRIPSFANAPRLNKLFLNDNEFTGPLPVDFLLHNIHKQPIRGSIGTSNNNNNSSSSVLSTGTTVTNTGSNGGNGGVGLSDINNNNNNNNNMLVTIDLSNNYLTGSFPDESLRHFQSLHINLVHNLITQPLPDYLCTKAQWMHGLVGLYGCNAILCPKGTKGGFQTSSIHNCHACPVSTTTETETTTTPETVYYLGALECPTTTTNDDDNKNDVDDSPALSPGGSSSSSWTRLETIRTLLEFYLALEGPRWEHNTGWNVFDVFVSSTTSTTKSENNILDSEHLDTLLETLQTTQTTTTTTTDDTTTTTSTTTTTLIDYCQFYGITCIDDDDDDGTTSTTTDGNNNKNIAYIHLSNNHLYGIMPIRILQLPTLVHLDVSFNPHLQVVDWLPPSVLTMPLSRQLQYLDLSHTSIRRLTGLGSALTFSFMDDINNDDDDNSNNGPPLQTLSLTGIDLQESSQLPDDLFALTNLQELRLDAIQIQGTLDGNQLQRLSNLRLLKLNQNQFRGSIPTQDQGWSALTDLQVLDLSDNEWTGTLSSNFLETALNLSQLHLSGSRGGLGGPLPTLSNLPALEMVELSFNQFYGQLPVDFVLDARQRQQGNESLSLPSSFLTIDLANNLLTGSIPAEWAQSTTTSSQGTPLLLNLQNNQISDIPTVVCQESSWMEGVMGTFGCPALLCPPGSWNVYGRATDANHLCSVNCPGNMYWGQTTCHNDSSVVPKLNPERVILDEFFQATGGRDWDWNRTDSGWEDPAAPLCQREGIWCVDAQGKQTITADEHITEIRMERFGLRGTIPSSIYQLPHLRRLAVAYNPVLLSFEGIEQATYLEVIQASHTKVSNLTGLAAASSLVQLFSIHLASCGISGPFPMDDVMALNSLRDLRLSSNHLTGPLPFTGWDQAKSLVSLRLDDNDMEGPLPPAMGYELPNLQELNLGQNLLTGPIPMEWATLNLTQSLRSLNLAGQRGSQKKITGPLLDFGTAPDLVLLDVSSNQLQGRLPTNFLASTDPAVNITVDLSNNMLEGGIPVEWGNRSHLAVYLANNRMNEPIPTDLCANEGWKDALGYMETLSTSSSCDFILCPPGTWSPVGRETNTDACTVCDDDDDDDLNLSEMYYGSTKCGDSSPLYNFSSPQLESLERERNALVAFYKATNGPESWIQNDNWELYDLITPSASTSWNICHWFGVRCEKVNGTLTVVELRLENNGLLTDADDVELDREEFRPDAVLVALSQLPNLRVLDLKGNDDLIIDFARHGIPPSTVSASVLYTWPSLETLRISKTAITSLSGLDEVAPQLTSLHAMDCVQLPSGPFPTELLQLLQLKELYLSFNNFNGTVPDAISNLVNLEQL